MSLAPSLSKVRSLQARGESVFGICYHRQNSLTDSVDTEGVDLENVRPSGGAPEWPKGSDCKSDARASVVRIHPPPPRIAPEGGVRTFGVGRGSRGESDAAGIV